MTYLIGGISSSSQFCHHSFLTIAPSDAVGCCCHCAFHFANGNAALTLSKSSLFQNSGHNGSFEGIIAGNSTTSHWSDMTSPVWFLSKRPVKSFVPHRVMTTMMAPPGCKRCRGPDVYHS